MTGHPRVLVAPDKFKGTLSADEAAAAMAEQRDRDDWPILATALALQCPIWTEDQDFFGAGVPTWPTGRVEIYLAAAE